MKISIASDLHMEGGITTNARAFIEAAKGVADLVILAGDIGCGAQAIPMLADAFDCPVLYVPGNHEYYNGHLQHTLAEMKEAADKTATVFVLDRDEVVLNGVRFLGATGWSDFSGWSDGLAEWRAQKGMNDYRAISCTDPETGKDRKLLTGDVKREAELTKDWLRKKLTTLFPGKTVAITHNAPSLLSIKGSPWYLSALTPSFVNNWESLMYPESLEDETPPLLWAHGHTHWATDHFLYKTRVISNPAGYASEQKTGQHYFKPDLLVEI